MFLRYVYTYHSNIPETVYPKPYLCPSPLNIIVEDLTSFIELCSYEYYDSEDLEFPPGFEPTSTGYTDNVEVDDWVSSGDKRSRR